MHDEATKQKETPSEAAEEKGEKKGPNDREDRVAARNRFDNAHPLSRSAGEIHLHGAIYNAAETEGG